MDKQFTASEARELGQLMQHGDDEDIVAGEMLHAFADLLEAQEKAVPVAYILANGTLAYASTSMPINNGTPLYTHPAPSDAERLAEALHDCIRDLRIAAEYGKTMRNPKALLETVERAEKVLAAHSAPAQPLVIDLDVLAWEQIKQAAAESKWIPHEHYYANDWHSDVCKFLREGAEQFIEPNSAQPPAASVTDAMVNAAMLAYNVECHSQGDATNARADGMRAALEAMLAAQENPNG